MPYYPHKTKTQAFAEFGARTKNKVNEYSAIAEDGSVVLECWYQHIKSLPDQSWRYQIDNLSSWSNSHGKELMVNHLQLAADEGRRIRLIIAKLKKNPNADIAGVDASNDAKDIITYHDRVGTVIELTKNNLIIDFRKQNKPS